MITKQSGKNKYIRFLALMIVVLISGCTTMPAMQVNHYPQTEGYKYASKGMIKVLQFEDLRPLEERKSPSTNLMHKQIWSGKTEPNVVTYLNNSMVKEIEASKLFSVSNSAHYELSGTIRTLRVVYQSRPIKIVPMLACAGSAVFPLGTMIVVCGLCAGVNASIPDPVTVTVAYDYVLRKNGQILIEDSIYQTVDKKIGTGLPRAKGVMKKLSALLDETVTTAIRKMLNNIDNNLTRTSQNQTGKVLEWYSCCV